MFRRVLSLVPRGTLAEAAVPAPVPIRDRFRVILPPEGTTLMSGEHLTDLATSWTTIRNAHTPGPAGQVAMHELIGRYHDAVERYLKLKLRDSNLADEVFQEFWTKLLTHKLAGADSNKGRFRDYLRTVLHRLIIDHFRVKKLQPLPPGDLLDDTRPDADYDRVWREAVIKRGMVPARDLRGQHAQEPLRTPSSSSAATAPRPRSRSSPSNSASRLRAPSPPKRSARPSSAPAPSSSSSSSRNSARPSIPASPRTSRQEIFDLGLGHLYRRYSTGADH